MADEASLMVHEVGVRGRRTMPSWLVALVVVAFVGVTAAFIRTANDRGDPDPGGRLLASLRPVASVVPGGARRVRRQFVEPRWDSCDGRASTYGWDDVTVDVSFDSHGLSDAAVLAHIRAGLEADGWTYDRSSTPGAWYWSRTLPQGHHAGIQLLGGSHIEPHNPWDLQASTGAAVHPIKDC